MPPAAGRSVLDKPEVIDALIDYLERGYPLRTATRRLGLGMGTPYYWRDQAQKGKDEYIQLWRRLEAAQAKAAGSRIDKLMEASDEGDTRATIWLLEHVYASHVTEDALGHDVASKEEDSPESRMTSQEQLTQIALTTLEWGLPFLQSEEDSQRFFKGALQLAKLVDLLRAQGMLPPPESMPDVSDFEYMDDQGHIKTRS
jgi:hypothetical protein